MEERLRRVKKLLYYLMILKPAFYEEEEIQVRFNFHSILVLSGCFMQRTIIKYKIAHLTLLRKKNEIEFNKFLFHFVFHLQKKNEKKTQEKKETKRFRKQSSRFTFYCLSRFFFSSFKKPILPRRLSIIHLNKPQLF